MIELVFVIVVLGILAAIAIPKFAATRTDAVIAKGRADVSALRSAIMSERQTRIIKGDSTFIGSLDAGVAANTEGVTIFDNNGNANSQLLMYGVVTKDADGHWMKTGNNTYTYKVGGVAVTFVYTPANGTFTCEGQNVGDAATYCDKLIH